jgi:hypothetical protein
LAGKEAQILPLVQPILDSFAQGFDEKYRPMLNGMIAQQAYDQNGQPISTAGQTQGYDPTQIGSLESAASQIMAAPTQMSTAISGQIPAIGGAMSRAVSSSLAAASINVNVNVTGAITGAQTTVTQTGGKSAGGGVDAGTTPNAGKVYGDTTTSRLLGTMAKHRRLNNMIAGRRTVTSALRGDNLGSLGSDHLTGNAYDLTGDNLGAYKTAVEKSGGFAELHGRGGSRHLHVAQGDTGTPWIGGGAMGGGGDSYVIQITPSQNATPEEIATAVMNRIERKQRDKKERG